MKLQSNPLEFLKGVVQILVVAVVLVPATVSAQDLGIRGGLGTDVAGGGA